jgi:hypothetical protein
MAKEMVPTRPHCSNKTLTSLYPRMMRIIIASEGIRTMEFVTTRFGPS